MNKTVVILRGVSGSGKSTVTNLLLANKSWISVSADHFFLGSHGEYNFDASKLGKAHQHCADAFEKALHNVLIEGIVVDNTNTKPKEFQWYIDEAEKAGATVISMVVENRHGNNSIHNVPQTTRDAQEVRIRQYLKLQ